MLLVGGDDEVEDDDGSSDVETKVALSSPLQVRYKFLHLIIGTVPVTKAFSRV